MPPPVFLFYILTMIFRPICCCRSEFERQPSKRLRTNEDREQLVRALDVMNSSWVALLIGKNNSKGLNGFAALRHTLLWPLYLLCLVGS